MEKKLKEIHRQLRALKSKRKLIEQELKAMHRELDKYYESPCVFYAVISGHRIKKINELEQKIRELEKERLNLTCQINSLLFKELEIYEKEVNEEQENLSSDIITIKLHLSEVWCEVGRVR